MAINSSKKLKNYIKLPKNDKMQDKNTFSGSCEKIKKEMLDEGLCI
jgi:hypothetical protein